MRKNLASENGLKNKAVANIKQSVRLTFPEYTDFSTVDGVRITLKNGWILIRASGTEPLIRVTVEGESLKVAEDILSRGTVLINKHLKELNR